MVKISMNPRGEPVPGLASMVVNRLVATQKQTGITYTEIKHLTVEDVYARCPFSDVIGRKPPMDDWKALAQWQKELDDVAGIKGINEWTKNIILWLRPEEKNKLDWLHT